MSTNRYESRIFTTICHFFSRYLHENNLTTEDAKLVTLPDFWNWINTITEEDRALEDIEDLTERFEVSQDEVELLLAAWRDKFFFSVQITPLWPLITFWYSTKLDPAPLSVGLTATITYRDKQIRFPVAELTSDDKYPVTVGTILSSWRCMLTVLENWLLAVPEGKLHEGPDTWGDNFSAIKEQAGD